MSNDFSHLQGLITDPDIKQQAYQDWLSHPGALGDFELKGSAGPRPSRMFLWETTRKVYGGKDTENFAQQIGDCFDGLTMVRMADGSEKPIEAVEIGEEVISAKGNACRVTSRIVKDYEGEIVTLRVKGQARDITATPDHGMRLVEKEQESWKAIGKLHKRERLLIPFYCGEPSRTYYDISENLVGSFEINDDSVIPARGHTRISVNRHIDFDKDFAWLIGLYLAEGGLTKDKKGRATRVDFNLGSHATDVIDRAYNTVEKVFGFTPKIQNLPSKPTVTYVRINNAVIARFFQRLIPGNTYTKRVPTDFFGGSEEVRLELLRGWSDGDGHARTDHDNAKLYVSSVCKELITDMYHVSLSLKIKASVVFRKAYKQSKKSAVLCFYGKEAVAVYPKLQDQITEKDRHWSNRSDITENGFAFTIKEIDRSYRKLKVYCLEVENDHSFIANGYAVHNCVSFGAKNAVEYLQLCMIALGSRFEFKNVFPPYFYGISRVQIGGQVHSNSDGSVGGWAAQGVMKYGVLATDTPNCPQYSGKVAKSWGYYGAPQEFIPVGQQHLVKSTALVSTLDQLKDAISNYYPVTVASDIGFDMLQRTDGMFYNSQSWGHQMCILGYDEGDSTLNIPPHACILNNWGSDCHGKIIDFRTKEAWPAGTLRVFLKDVARMLSQGDSFAYSDGEFFESRQLPVDFFKPW